MPSATRRSFLQRAGLTALGLLTGKTRLCSAANPVSAEMIPTSAPLPENSRAVTLFLCGDVMTGRGIDQILPHAGDPRLYEPYMKSARGYVELAEAESGPIPKPVDFDYIWGDALEILARRVPNASIINLETALTRSDDAWPGKGIHYRMHPENIPCLTTAPIDCCVLANNHVLDWGYQGLAETLRTLRQAGLKTAGAGLDRQAAAAPAILERAGKGRIIVLAFGHPSSGIPLSWAAQPERPGVNLLEQLSSQTVQRIAEQVQAVKGANAIVVVSIHWGGNWGYHVPDEQRRFAHRLIDEAGVHVIHGHSSHHPRGIEVYREKPILYGCGDFLNDYEGIQGHERFRGDLTLMYFATLDPDSGRLIRFTMAPMQIRRFRLQRASAEDARWLHTILDRESRRFGCRVVLNEDFTLTLRWAA